MILSDQTITAAIMSNVIGVRPFDTACVQPSSLDVRLSSEFLFMRDSDEPLDTTHSHREQEIYDSENNFYVVLQPGDFVLGSTIETVRLPNNIVARLEGRSSYGRLGLMVHSTAGYIDPGFDGTITLELSNVGVRPLKIRSGARIGQLTFYRMDVESAAPYGSEGLGSKYQNQHGAVGSRVGLDTW